MGVHRLAAGHLLDQIVLTVPQAFLLHTQKSFGTITHLVSRPEN